MIQIAIALVGLCVTFFGAMILTRDYVRELGLEGAVEGHSETIAYDLLHGTDLDRASAPYLLGMVAVVSPEGVVLASRGDVSALSDATLAGLAERPRESAVVPEGRVLPLNDGNWLIAGLDPRWVAERTEARAPVIAMLCLASGVVIYILARMVDLRIWRRMYPLEPEQVDRLARERAMLLESMSDGAIAIDEKQNILWLNAAARDLLDIPPGVLEPCLPESLRAHLREEAKADSVIDVGGRLLLVHVNRPAQNVEGTSRLVVFRDYSQLTVLLDELDGALSHAEMLRARSHEFANTIHLISGLLELGLIDEARRFVHEGGLIGDHLVVAHGLDDDFARALVLAYRARAHESGITLTLTSGSHLPSLETVGKEFANAVYTIIGNFLSNAIEACTRGDRVEIGIEWTTVPEPELRIVVDDSGPGVDAALGDRVFDSAVTTKTPRESHGVGLAIVRAAAERQRGAVAQTSSELGGARFSATLRPTREVAAAAQELSA